MPVPHGPQRQMLLELLELELLELDEPQV